MANVGLREIREVLVSDKHAPYSGRITGSLRCLRYALIESKVNNANADQTKRKVIKRACESGSL